MPTYKYPGVYVEEVSTIPPSIAQVETAIPAFFGYTEKATGLKGGNLKGVPTRISTFLEYRELFGGPKAIKFDAVVTMSGSVDIDTPTGVTPEKYMLYHAVDMFFRNGGGPCYIVPVGLYSDNAVAKEDFENGLEALKKEDEPTLIVLTDAVTLTNDYYGLCQAALAQCDELMDRFTIIDVLYNANEKPAAIAKEFRDKLVSNDLMYGGAYLPQLETTLTYGYDEQEVQVKKKYFQVTSGSGLKVSFNGAGEANAPILKADPVDPAAAGVEFAFGNNSLTISNLTTNGVKGSAIVSAFETWVLTQDNPGFVLEKAGNGSAMIMEGGTITKKTAGTGPALATFAKTQTGLYNQVKAALSQKRIVMYPSAAMAGIYAAVDAARGVWKAPANVVVNSVIRPMLKINNKDQEGLNIDPGSGKSINAIRSFPGQGTLVWGARTLAGNDNEWRYVSVRRFFNMVEESVEKAAGRYVFEPNDANTWVQVSAMISSYLNELWKAGALAGPTPESSYFVNIGLGTTMSNDDILNGRMIIEIGLAAVRPAEFIILRFSHKMQEA